MKISPLRQWTFRLLAMSLPLLLLGGVEGGLRLLEVGNPTEFALESDLNGRTVWTDNPRFTWQFFGQDLARAIEPFALAPEPADQTVRIFVLGGSAAKGVPEPAFGMARVMEVLLRDRYPDVKFEVVNAAITACNSHVMLPVARACGELAPDLFVVYLGNNEVVGPYGAGTVFNPFESNLWGIHTAITLRSLRSVQWLASLTERKGQVWKGMAMFLENQVRVGDASLARTQTNFEQNLREIIRHAENASAKVVLSSVGVNLKHSPPFASLHSETLPDNDRQRWDDHFQLGVRNEADEQWERAITAYQAAAAIDDAYAELSFRLARCYSATGDHRAALSAYSKARELDALRFRADTRINAIIRQVAKEEAWRGVVFADAEARLAAAAPAGITGNESFYEHVHLNFAGNVTVGRALADAAQEAMPVWTQEHRVNGALLSTDKIALRMGRTPLDELAEVKEILRMVAEPPFTNQLDHESTVESLRSKRTELSAWTQGKKLQQALETQQRAIAEENSPASLRIYYATALLNHDGDAREAEEVLAKLREELPASPAVLTASTQALLALDRADDAIELYEQAITARPWDIALRRDLGKSFASGGAAKTGYELLSAALELRPNDIQTHLFAGNALQKLGRPLDAIAHFEEALKIKPDYAAAHNNWGNALQSLQRFQEAISHYEQALQLKPDYATAHNNWGNTLQKLGQFQAAVLHYSAALRIRPGSASTHNNLGNALMAQGRPQQAVEQYRKASAVIGRTEGPTAEP
jgi:tetratricopeptide (TPR) repeat protein